jgi:hypothetical protein
MGRFGESDRMWSRMFEDGNRILFERPVDERGRAWWIAKFYEPYNLTPEGMGDLITRSVSEGKLIKYQYIDGVTEEFSLRVEGRFRDDGEIWYVHRTLALTGPAFSADEMFIPTQDRKVGRGSRLMKDLIDAAGILGVSRIDIEAEKVGSYAWLLMGFVPDRGSWRNIQLEAQRFIQMHQRSLGPVADELFRKVSTGRPEMARILALMDTRVPSADMYERDGTPVQVPFGKALFLERGIRWTGEFTLDPASLKVAEDYIAESGDDRA